MKQKQLLIILGLLLTTQACGGGGGGGSDTPFYGGIWRGVAVLERNDCNVDVDDDILFEHTVNQNERQIVLDTGSRSFPGTLHDDDTGFTVSGNVIPPSLTSPTVACRFDAALGYFDIDGDSATVAFLFRATCADGVRVEECDLAYVGPAVRE